MLPATAPASTDTPQLSYPTALSTIEVHRIAALPVPPGTSSTHGGGGKAGASSRDLAKGLSPKSSCAAVPAQLPPAVPKRTHDGLLVDGVSHEPAEFQAVHGVGGAELAIVAQDDTRGAATDIAGTETQQAGDDACRAVGAAVLGGGGGGAVAHRESMLPEPPPSIGCHPASSRSHSSRAAPPFAAPRAYSSSPRGLASPSALVGRTHPQPCGSCSGVILAQSMIATPRRVKSDPVSLHAKRAAQWKLDPYLSLTKKRA